MRRFDLDNAYDFGGRCCGGSTGVPVQAGLSVSLAKSAPDYLGQPRDDFGRFAAGSQDERTTAGNASSTLAGAIKKPPRKGSPTDAVIGEILK